MNKVNKVSIISYNQTVKLTFLDYDTVIIFDKKFRDTVINGIIPVVARFSKEHYAWVYSEMEGVKTFHEVDSLVDSEMASFIDQAKVAIKNDMKVVFNGDKMEHDFEDLKSEDW